LETGRDGEVYLHYAIRAGLFEDAGQTRKPVRVKQWKRPEEGWLKINTDAAFDANTCTGSAGVVIHDHSGLVVSAAARWFDGIPDTLTAKASAAKEGLELALELGYDRVILEVDCQGLKTLLGDPSSMRSSIGGLLLRYYRARQEFW
jgi:hypothetical protein